MHTENLVPEGCRHQWTQWVEAYTSKQTSRKGNNSYRVEALIEEDVLLTGESFSLSPLNFTPLEGGVGRGFRAHSLFLMSFFFWYWLLSWKFSLPRSHAACQGLLGYMLLLSIQQGRTFFTLEPSKKVPVFCRIGWVMLEVWLFFKVWCLASHRMQTEIISSSPFSLKA